MSIARILSSKSRDIATSSPEATLSEAARILAEKRIGAILVTNAKGELLGILSERDIVRVVGMQGPEAMVQTISKHMTTKVITCNPSMSINNVMEAMTAGRFRHMPVMEDGVLTGIISIGDVVKHRVAEIEGEAQAMRDYIAMA